MTQRVDRLFWEANVPAWKEEIQLRRRNDRPENFAVTKESASREAVAMAPTSSKGGKRLTRLELCDHTVGRRFRLGHWSRPAEEELCDPTVGQRIELGHGSRPAW